MSDLIVTIAALVVSALFGACIGFVAARMFSTNVERHEQTSERSAPAPALVRFPGNVSAVPPTPALVVSHIVEVELSDAEIDALPVDLPFLSHARPRIASPLRKRAMNRL